MTAERQSNNTAGKRSKQMFRRVRLTKKSFDNVRVNKWRASLLTVRHALNFTVTIFVLLSFSVVQAQPPGGPRQRPKTPASPANRPGTPAQAPPKPAQAKPGADEGEEQPEIPEFKPVPPRAKVTFNLEGANLQELVRLISDMTGRRFIIPGKIRDIEATVYAPTKVTAAEAYQAFLSVLAVNGLTVVPAGRYLKVQETAGIEGQALPTFTGDGAPGGDRYITRLIRLQNVSAEDAQQLLGKFKSKDGNLTAYAPTNMIVVTDTGRNISRMTKILKAIDVARKGQRLWVEPVHYASAAEISDTIQEIFPAEQSSGGNDGGSSSKRSSPPSRPNSPSGQSDDSPVPSTVGATDEGGTGLTKIFPDERTNSLVILASEPAYLRVIQLIRQFDVPVDGEGKIRVHFLQHGDSEEIASTLQNLISGSGGSSSPSNARGRNNSARTPANQTTPASTGGDLFEGQVRVTAHPASNALVITSSLHDYAALRKVIDELDAPRRQVYIEAVIMEVSVQRGSSLGLAYHGGVGDAPVDGSLSVFGFQGDQIRTVPGGENPAGAIGTAALSGATSAVIGPAIDNSQQIIGVSVPAFGVALNALATSRDANVLSTPHLIALDNTEAEISVGQNVPLQTSGIAGGIGGIGGLAGLAGQQGQDAGAGGAGLLAGLAAGQGGFAGQVPRQDIGTTLRITPHIGDEGNIRLEIEEEISEIEGNLGSASVGSLGVVPFNRREARTEVSVKDQQTVVIGGLIHDVTGEQEQKVPVLGDIPLLGMLFRNRTTIKEKRNLILVLTPYIIRDPSDLRSVFERKMRERQEFIDRYIVFNDKDYSPPLDYSRTKGLVAEINTSLRNMEEEIRLINAREGGQNKTHYPRAPVETDPSVIRRQAARETESTRSEGGDIIIESSGPPGGASLSEEEPSSDGETSSAIEIEGRELPAETPQSTLEGSDSPDSAPDDSDVGDSGGTESP